MNEQLSIFDFIDGPPKEDPAPPSEDYEDLKDWAFLYTVGKAGRNSGIRFMMTLEDAKVWCSSDLSKGNMHGNPWMYMFTSVYNFCFCHWGQLKDVNLDLTKLFDNGQWDDKIESLGLRKYDKYDIQDVLKEYGITVNVAKYPNEVSKQIFDDDF